MEYCIICDNEFSLPKSDLKLEKLFHSVDNNNKRYMCEGCFIERSQNEFRIIEGVLICANKYCGRNAMNNSNYCEICNNKNI